MIFHKMIKTSCYKDVMNGSSPAEPIALKVAQKKDVETGEFWKYIYVFINFIIINYNSDKHNFIF